MHKYLKSDCEVDLVFYLLTGSFPANILHVSPMPAVTPWMNLFPGPTLPMVEFGTPLRLCTNLGYLISKDNTADGRI
jgi:hypothetical protein